MVRGLWRGCGVLLAAACGAKCYILAVLAITVANKQPVNRTLGRVQPGFQVRNSVSCA